MGGINPNKFDNELSILTGRTKKIKTKPKDYTYGEDYFDSFRTLDGLDYGFELEKRIDNKKVSVSNDETLSKFILNRKNNPIRSKRFCSNQRNRKRI